MYPKDPIIIALLLLRGFLFLLITGLAVSSIVFMCMQEKTVVQHAWIYWLAIQTLLLGLILFSVQFDNPLRGSSCCGEGYTSWGFPYAMIRCNVNGFCEDWPNHIDWLAVTANGLFAINLALSLTGLVTLIRKRIFMKSHPREVNAENPLGAESSPIQQKDG